MMCLYIPPGIVIDEKIDYFAGLAWVRTARIGLKSFRFAGMVYVMRGLRAAGEPQQAGVAALGLAVPCDEVRVPLAGEGPLWPSRP